MGIYNCASTLVEALDSLYSQTYQDFKIILCEDGSSDNTYQVATDYAARHDNIVLLRNERNLGLNATLNRCLQVVDTQYVARMDGDDISLPARFEQEVRFLDDHPEYALVSAPMIYFDDNGDFRTDTATAEPAPATFVHSSPFCHAPVMVRAEAYRAVGGYTVSKYLLRVEDQHLWFKMYQRGFKGYNLQQPLYKMRDDRNAKGRRTFANRRNEAYLRWLICRGFSLPLKSYLHIAVPIVKWLAPLWIYDYYHRRK